MLSTIVLKKHQGTAVILQIHRSFVKISDHILEKYNVCSQLEKKLTVIPNYSKIYYIFAYFAISTSDLFNLIFNANKNYRWSDNVHSKQNSGKIELN